jgi:hypothetical protein
VSIEAEVQMEVALSFGSAVLAQDVGSVVEQRLKVLHEVVKNHTFNKQQTNKDNAR